MSKARICQFTTGFHPGDAISHEILTLNDYFQKLNYNTAIFTEYLSPAYKKLAFKYKLYEPKKNDIIVYHHSIHSNILEFLLNHKQPKVLIYHNVTPPKFYESYDLTFSFLLSQGKKELESVKSEFAIALADSEFNKKELESMGYNLVYKFPIVYNFQILQEEPVFREQFDGPKIIFVGRISPNKKQCDLIRFAEVYKKFFRKNFQIRIVGYPSPASKSYMEELEHLVRFFDLTNQIHFSGYVTQKELNGYYKSSDIFLSMSEHEGFCVPLLEAMYFQLPIVAYSAGAVPETLNGAGILIKEKNFPFIAELIEELLSNQDFKNKIIQKQNQRLESYKQIPILDHIKEILQQIESMYHSI